MVCPLGQSNPILQPQAFQAGSAKNLLFNACLSNFSLASAFIAPFKVPGPAVLMCDNAAGLLSVCGCVGVWPVSSDLTPVVDIQVR